MSPDPLLWIAGGAPVEGAVHLPLLHISHLPLNLDLTAFDLLIATSKNAVISINKQDKYWKKLSFFVIGDATARTAREQGGAVEYVSESGSGEGFAPEIAARLEGRRALYLRGRDVAHDLRGALDALGVRIEERVVYESVCQPSEGIGVPPEGSVIVFTSPKTYRCFTDCYGWRDSYVAVAIGPTTAAAFDPGIRAHTAPEADIRKAAAFARSLKSERV